MGLAHVLLDSPGEWVEFRSNGVRIRARFDPMFLGAENLPSLIDKPPLVRRLLDDESKLRFMVSDPFGSKTVTLLLDYLEAVGLGAGGLGLLIRALDDIELLEVDLLRLGLEVRDWLDPEGSLSSRRVALIMRDLRARPETQTGAKHMDIEPASKAAITGAQSLSSKEQKHRFLKSPSELAAEEEAMRLAAEKRERIKQRGF